MTQKYALTTDGFIERLKDEHFDVVQIHASLARRNYLLGEFVLWCSSQGHAYLMDRAEYEEAGTQRRLAKWLVSEMLYYEDGAERMLAEIRKRVTPVVVVPEFIAKGERIAVLVAWANKRMETTKEGKITVTEETPTVDFHEKPGDKT